MFLATFLWRKRARLTDLSFLNTISPVLCPIWDGVKLNLYLGWRGLKVRPELTTWVYGAWCGHLCSQAELDGELSGRRCWFCGLSTDPTAHHALWECTRSYADPMRSHAFNQSIAKLWRDQPLSCWTAPTGNVDSPLLPAESLSTAYYEFLEHLWHDVGGSKESFQTEKIPEDIEV